MPSGTRASLLDVEALTVSYPAAGGATSAVLRDFGLQVGAGEVVGLTGASGSGKSTLALAILGLLPSGSRVEGRIVFEGRNLLGLTSDGMRALRGRRLALVWQEPGSALNPVLRCGRQVAEVLRAHTELPGAECRRKAAEMLAAVQLPERAASAYPHELSGGQLQRVVLAQALVCEPSLVILDEPTASLDTVTQAEILRLIAGLRRRVSASFLFITHNHALLAGFADRVCCL